jgi:signal transduction histidine kinase
MQILEGFQVSTQLLNQTLEDLHKILVIKKQPSIDQEEIDLSDTVEIVINQLNNLISEIQPKIDIDFGKIASIRFNKVYLESIFLNLFTNAIKYRSSNRMLEISIHTVDDGDGVLLVFKDNGIGIDVNRYKDRLFGLYQKFTDHPEGKGFGLYLMKSQIESLGGSIAIESTVDVGTKFLIRIPRWEK